MKNKSNIKDFMNTASSAEDAALTKSKILKLLDENNRSFKDVLSYNNIAERARDNESLIMEKLKSYDAKKDVLSYNSIAERYNESLTMEKLKFCDAKELEIKLKPVGGVYNYINSNYQTISDNTRIIDNLLEQNQKFIDKGKKIPAYNLETINRLTSNNKDILN